MNEAGGSIHTTRRRAGISAAITRQSLKRKMYTEIHPGIDPFKREERNNRRLNPTPNPRRSKPRLRLNGTETLECAKQHQTSLRLFLLGVTYGLKLRLNANYGPPISVLFSKYPSAPVARGSPSPVDLIPRGDLRVEVVYFGSFGCSDPLAFSY
jgi:hypothetical protein